LFDEVALLATPRLTIEAMESLAYELRGRVASLTQMAFQTRQASQVARLSTGLASLDQALQCIQAAKGGDLDAAEQARRLLIEFDAALAELEAERAWPELQMRIEQQYLTALSWISGFGSASERAGLEQAVQGARTALTAKNAKDAERHLEIVERLGHAAALRRPGVWRQLFEDVEHRTAEFADPKQGQLLVTQGRTALQRSDDIELERCVRALWQELPVDAAEQALGHGSGVRTR
jgi:hypothetical protein